MQPQSCTPRVKAAPPTRRWSKFMGPLGGSINVGGAPGALHSGSYVILDINMLKEAWERPFCSKVQHHCLSCFLGEFWTWVPLKNNTASKGHPTTAPLEISLPHDTSWMRIKAFRVPAMLGAKIPRWKPSHVIVWAQNTNKIISNSKGISNTRQHGTMRNREDSCL